MILVLLLLILGVGAAVGQAQTSNAKPGKYSSSSADHDVPQRTVQPEEPVITVQGICKEGAAKAEGSGACQTAVTRGQFERLLAGLAAAGQSVPPGRRQELAQTYVDFLAYEQGARAAGTEDSPEFRDLMNWVRLRTLTEVYRHSLQEKYRNPSAQEIDDHYHRDLLSFTDVKLRRILIPRKNPAAKNQEEYEKRALQLANEVRERAAKGEDPDLLQKEAYTTLGLTTPPSTDLGNRRKASLLADEGNEVFALSVGGVSKVEQEPYSFVIYKVESKYVLPLEVVKDEISRAISRQRLNDALKALTSAVHSDFNPLYFTLSPLPPAPPVPQQQPSPQTPH